MGALQKKSTNNIIEFKVIGDKILLKGEDDI